MFASLFPLSSARVTFHCSVDEKGVRMIAAGWGSSARTAIWRKGGEAGTSRGECHAVCPSLRGARSPLARFSFSRSSFFLSLSLPLSSSLSLWLSLRLSLSVCLSFFEPNLLSNGDRRCTIYLLQESFELELSLLLLGLKTYFFMGC